MRGLFNLLPVSLQYWLIRKGYKPFLSDDDPRARPMAVEVTAPDGVKYEVVVEPNGRMHGLPGSPPDGLMPADFDAWYEKMKTFRGWK